ncbi:hypothetical protein E2C01_095254 [Portunus trituberculatus]|uniref:Uncharacterized protein n=1 Tax=Portunus trituberculatus TaxID=210409 RepID=A0A5B7K5B0_PORTR|nr:hypothetical protein [Portunus trituberculatus]
MYGCQAGKVDRNLQSIYRRQEEIDPSGRYAAPTSISVPSLTSWRVPPNPPAKASLYSGPHTPPPPPPPPPSPSRRGFNAAPRSNRMGNMTALEQGDEEMIKWRCCHRFD